MARRAACAVVAGLCVLLGACRARSECDGIVCNAACPRDAERDSSGRCACLPGDVLVLGACVPPEVADAYCGPAAKAGLDGCVFRVCGADERLDAATGACLPKSTLGGAGVACMDGGAPVVALGRIACLDAEATCPRGTDRVGAVCPRPARCPPGTLASEGACRALTTVGARDDLPHVDLGGWAALVLGASGAPGKADLCRPLSLRPDVFGLPAGRVATVALRIAIVVPNQDLTRVHARTHANLSRPEARPLSAAAEAVVNDSVATLIEPLRGLGGEASTEVVELEVTCRVSSL